ncbi:MAG: 2Fe-2S iron-sulfur cluster-binding protein [Flavitalea sp.]
MFHKLKISSVAKNTPDSIVVSFEIPETLQQAFQFKPGQNLTLKTLLQTPAGVEDVRRSYSICSSPGQPLSVGIKRADNGLFSNWANESLSEGSLMEVLSPAGSFGKYSVHSAKRNYLAIAAGSGITPIISLITHKLKDEPDCNISLIYGNRSKSSIMFRDAICDLKNQYMHRFVVHHILSREIPDAEVYAGRIDAAKCAAFSKQLIDFERMDEIYLCGPAAMIDHLKEWLISDQKIESSRIHFELFLTPEAQNSPQTLGSKFIESSLLSSGQSSSIDVRIRIDGFNHDFEMQPDAESILEAGIKNGIDLPFSCKGGVCATCRAKLVEGEVEMELNYALESEEVNAGYILTCQSHPKTDRIFVDFDLK